MSFAIEVPAHHAYSLQLTLDALIGETAALKEAGLLAVTAGELIDGGGSVNEWLADLEICVDAAIGQSVVMPVRDASTLQHIVYGLSAVLVWADGMRRDGRLLTTLSIEALAAWGEVEKVVGLGGRTSGGIGPQWGSGTGETASPSHSGVDLLQVIHVDAA